MCGVAVGHSSKGRAQRLWRAPPCGHASSPELLCKTTKPPPCRLTDIKANAKFSSPYATAEDISSVRGRAVCEGGCEGLCRREEWGCGGGTARARTHAPPHLPLPACARPAPAVLQGRREDLRSVVDHLKKRFGVEYIYCWHGAPRQLPPRLLPPCLPAALGGSRAACGRAFAAQAGRCSTPLPAHAAAPSLQSLPAHVHPVHRCPLRRPQACLLTGAACRPRPPPSASTSHSCSSPSPRRG